MANRIDFPLYYGPSTLSNESYANYLRTQAMTNDIKESIEIAEKSIVATQIESTEALGRNMNAGFNDLSGKLGVINNSLNAVSRQIGEMGVAMNMGFVRLDTTVQKSAIAICERLDCISDTLQNPSLTQAREYYVRALVNYKKGFYEEALEEVKECLKINKVDYISWFLMGKVYLFGLGEFSDVIDLDSAINAFTQAAKYITPDSRQFIEARLLASEILFYLALAIQNKAYNLLHYKNKDGTEKLLSEAAQRYSQAYTHSEKMLEALYNAARCYISIGNINDALECLKTIIRKDGSYKIKVARDPDFKEIQLEKLSFDVNNGILVKYFGSNKDLSIPDSLIITSIGERAFFRKNLTKVILPANITTIGNVAFYGNALTSVVIPPNVTTIGSGAFSYNALTSVTLPSNLELDNQYGDCFPNQLDIFYSSNGKKAGVYTWDGVTWKLES